MQQNISAAQNTKSQIIPCFSLFKKKSLKNSQQKKIIIYVSKKKKAFEIFHAMQESVTSNKGAIL